MKLCIGPVPQDIETAVRILSHYIVRGVVRAKRHYDRGGSNGEGHGKGHGKPEDPGQGNPNPGSPDDPGQPGDPPGKGKPK